CHSLNFVAFRDLKQLGYNDAEIKKIASDWKNQVPSVNPDTGEAATRKALPPDLSLLSKAREGGAAYIYSILTGYQNQPAELLHKFPDAKTPPNLHYNPYFANLNLAMPQPLRGGDVTFADGTPNTLQNEARDVSAFLVWTAEPNLERRHAAGLSVAIFLLIATILAYLAKDNIWADTKRDAKVASP